MTSASAVEAFVKVVSLVSAAPLTAAGGEVLSAATANAHRKAARRRNDMAAGHHKQQRRPTEQLARPAHDQLARQRTQSTMSANGANKLSQRVRRPASEAAQHKSVAHFLAERRLKARTCHAKGPKLFGARAEPLQGATDAPVPAASEATSS